MCEWLDSCSVATNKSIDLSKKHSKKEHKIPTEVSFYSKLKVNAHKHWLRLSDDISASHEEKQKAKEEFQKARQIERKIKRKFLIDLEEERNSDLFSILSQNPKTLFQRLKQN